MTPQAPNFFFPWAKRAKFCQKVFVLFPWCPFLPCRGSASFSALKKCPGIAHHFFEKNQKCPRKLSCRNSGGVQKQGPLPIMGKTFFLAKKSQACRQGQPCLCSWPALFEPQGVRAHPPFSDMRATLSALFFAPKSETPFIWKTENVKVGLEVEIFWGPKMVFILPKRQSPFPRLVFG